jgi:hypothetical protein
MYVGYLRRFANHQFYNDGGLMNHDHQPSWVTRGGGDTYFLMSLTHCKQYTAS